MKHIISVLFFFVFTILSYSQKTNQNSIVIQEEEVERSIPLEESVSEQARSSSTDQESIPNAPNQSPTSVIDNLSTGTINESNGKVNLTIPITEITTNRLSIGLYLKYNGANAMEYVDYTNETKSTGIVGLGWDINRSKIIAENKGTGNRNDDDFYLLDRESLKKLICVKKHSLNYYEFKVENLPNWNVYYDKSKNYWKIIKDNGDSYYYGNSDVNVAHNANENIIRWNNWIGDSRAEGGTLQTLAWNLSKISNQWNDKIEFFYKTIDQAVQANNQGPKHTEASYLTRIVSNSGEQIELSYSNKLNTTTKQEYYEPHTEINEPDAYQEQYEKKYLDNIILRKSDGQQLSKHQFGYEVYGANLLSKRHLTTITTYNADNEFLTSQHFEYFTSGPFKGTIQKIKSTTGAEVTYEYENKFLFTNNAIEHPHRKNQSNYATFFKTNNFCVTSIRRPQNDANNSIKFDEKITLTNNGIDFQTKIITDVQAYPWNRARTDKLLLGERFYGYLRNNILVTNCLQNDGVSFKRQRFELPRPTTSNWDSKIKYAIRNDYILIKMGENRIVPLIRNGGSFEMGKQIEFDHVIEEFIGKNGIFLVTTTKPNKPNYILRYQLDKTFSVENLSYDSLLHEYNVNKLDYEKVLNLSDLTLRTTELSKYFLSDKFYNNAIKGFHFFNGKGWLESQSFAGDFMSSIDIKHRFRSRFYRDNTYPVGLLDNYFTFFDPNFDRFSPEQMITTTNNGNPRIIHMGKYTILGNSYTYSSSVSSPIYKFKAHNLEYIDEFTTGYSGYSNDYKLSPSKRNLAVFNNSSNKDVPSKVFYFHIDKKDLSLKKTMFDIPSIGNIYRFKGDVSDNYIVTRYYHNDQGNFYRIIDDHIGQDVYDVVVKSIDVHNGDGRHFITAYTYNNHRTLNNGSALYGEVISEKKGAGSANIGKVYNYYNPGNQDIRKLGLLEKTVIKDSQGKMVQQFSTEMDVSADLFTHNSENTPIFIGNWLLLKKKTSQSYFYKNSQTNKITTQEEYEYNQKGLISKIKKRNSKGILEEQITEYGYQNSNAFENKNILNAVSKRTSLVNNAKTWVTSVEWANVNGKLYPNKEYSGPQEIDLRLTSEITKISNKGVVEETTNGKGLYAVNLSGYNYKRSVASIENAKFSEVMAKLDVSYHQLQNLNNSQLRNELMKLYTRLPNAMIKLSFYDDNGNIISEIDARQEEIKYHYDSLSRLEYITDSNNHVLKRNVYNYKMNQ